MKLHWHPIKELVHKLTGLAVEKSAAFELTNYFEEQIKKVILQSKEELQKLNSLKEIQGLYQKNRIDRDCIKNAIKTLNTKNDSRPTQNCVRKVKEKEVNIEVT